MSQRAEQYFADRIRRLETWVLLGGVIEPPGSRPNEDYDDHGLAPERITALSLAELDRRGTPFWQLGPFLLAELEREPDPAHVQLPDVVARALARLREDQEDTTFS
jgi:hypothetical protein